MGRVHDGFKQSFPEVEQGRVQANNYSHLDLGGVDLVNQFLDRFRVPAAEASSIKSPVIVRPSVKYTVIAESGDWQCDVQVDHSLYSSTAVSVSLHRNFLKISPELSFLEKLSLVQNATAECLEMIDLEHIDGTQE